MNPTNPTSANTTQKRLQQEQQKIEQRSQQINQRMTKLNQQIAALETILPPMRSGIVLEARPLAPAAAGQPETFDMLFLEY